MASPEELKPSVENTADNIEAAAEQLEKLEQKQEKAGEKSPENNEKAKNEAEHEAKEQAISTAEKKSTEREDKGPSSARGRTYGTIGKKEKAKAFDKHMKHVQAEMSAPSRVFSKIIHNKVVETTSDAVGSTVARPDAILSGAVAAFFLVLAVYVLAKMFGYVLSGFETILAFIIGWLLGIIYDYLKTLITGKSA